MIIPDVEKLIEKIYYLDSSEALQEGIIPLIDSLAVEVPEAKPVAWRCFHCGFETTDMSEAVHFGDGEGEDAICVYWSKLSKNEKIRELQETHKQLNSSRAELAQLQAELKFEEAENDGLAKNIDKAIAEIKNLKGALRTLAYMGDTCPESDTCREFLTCEDCKIAHALAHPTPDHPSPLANGDM